MSKYDDSFLALVDDFSKYELVEGIMLAGSRTTANFDKDSDYDLYIYSKQEIPLEFRKKLAEKYFNYAELDNKTWEQEDQGFFKYSNIQIDIVYRDVNCLEGMLENVVIKHQASTGYTTCFWSNLINSDILYDEDGELQVLKESFDIEYPEELRRNIIAKNYPILNQIIPAYTKQIEKALKRDDVISINHRTSAFFESYFDIIFALNKTLHPGEKKLLKIVSGLEHTPENMERDIRKLFGNLYKKDFDIVNKLNEISDNLAFLLRELKMLD
ncbi:uncharacterized protein DUF4037 [Orenia metallireducens]|uniref:DUF4037 domain-containing protein n=1 Tax=Orenia metallireducens TaxID=1413210 RepID=UPI000D4C7B4F|nr:DUF4037 domain-containing protein [Orenia metallireducens]PRX32597.1 uncharacterized protein DUF4037 [Orenia metallireducens]